MKTVSKAIPILACDFETTVDGTKEQNSTEVWSAASVELYTENVIVNHSIEEFFEYLFNRNEDLILYFHNLKFDGMFILYSFLNTFNFKQGYLIDEKHSMFKKRKQLENNEFIYTISAMGQWYTITLKYNEHFYEFRDSLKLMPMSLREVGKGFNTKHRKLDMEYTGYRYAGCEITPEEMEYIKNDVLVLKEALEIMFAEGHSKLTIGSCCMSEFKRYYGQEDYDQLFPDLTQYEIDISKYGSANADEYIRHSYKGGWCYLVPERANKLVETGTTGDVNSLYPSVMHSESGSIYPTGLPHFWKGNIIPDEALKQNRYFFIRIKTRFYIKDGYLPTVQIKRTMLYKPTEWLTTSDVLNPKTGEYVTHYTDRAGNIYDTRVTLTLTMTDYYRLLQHYELVDFEILDGCWFFTQIGLFDDYINKYKEIKMNSKGAKRTIAKLFLNNLYGKLASSTDSSYKIVYAGSNSEICFREVNADEKKAGYIAIGSAITSYARNFTIEAAQKNYHPDGHGFIYADTDSIHCDLAPEEMQGIKVDDNAFCCWKLEASWDSAIFVRQKTYIEHVTAENLQPIEKPYYNIKCAGMPDSCKRLLNMSLTGDYTELDSIKDEQQRQFAQTPRTLTDFKKGLTIGGKLMPKRIKGGVLLVETTYEMR